MTNTLSDFAHQFIGAVLASLIPVVLTAFVSIPLNLGGHPGEVRADVSQVSRHMT